MARTMDAGAMQWLYKYAHKNKWRVPDWYEFDDLVSEGIECYYETRMRYPTATTPQHIMSLFKLVFICRVHDLSKKKTKQVDLPVADLTNENITEAAFLERYGSFEEMCTALAFSPTARKAVIVMMTDKRCDTPMRRRRDGTRETINQRLCRLIGVDSKDFDILDNLKHFLTS